MTIKLSARMKELRIQNKYTMLEVASKLGVSEATYQRYETGKIKSVPYEKIEHLSEIFCCSPAYLMGWEYEPKTATAAEVVTVPTAENKYKRITDTLDTLNEAGVYEVEKHAEYIATRNEYKKPNGSEVVLRKEEA